MHQQPQVQCMFSAVSLQERRFDREEQRVGKVAPGSRLKTFYTESHRSPLNCQQKKNRSDGQLEQNDAKVILFKTGGRYSSSAWIRISVHFLENESLHDLWATTLSREFVSRSTCLLLCAEETRWSLEALVQVWRAWGGEVRSWKVQRETKWRRTQIYKNRIKKIKYISQWKKGKKTLLTLC